MKKVLIISVTAGNAHNACAKSMKRKLENFTDVNVKIVDLLKCYSTKLNYWIADKGYSFAVSKLLPLYNVVFDYYKKANPEYRYSCSVQKTILSTLNGLMNEILLFKPDVIYATHFYGAVAITDLKLLYNLPCKTIATNLDYENSPFWEAGIGVDYFTIPNEDFIDETIFLGFKREQLLPFGIPVDERTLLKVDKKEALENLGLDKDLFTIMVMFGGGYWSGGFKIFKNLIKALKGEKVQVIMINGRDKKSFNKINKMKFEENIKVINLGFCEDVPIYLSASDLILNKFGGASATEMINKSIPMLITEKIPAQEKYSLIYMKEKGVALSFKNARELKQKVIYLMENPEKLNDMTNRLRPLQKHAILDLANFIYNLPNADYTELLKQDINTNNTKKLVKKVLKQKDKQSRKDAKIRK